MDTRTQELQERFGLEAFRPWQREAVDALLDDGRPVLVVAPTGGGKSLCYQFPATQLEGTTVVVSPLIALMEDQVRALTERGVAATYIASSLDFDEQKERWSQVAQGAFDLVYVAPERLANPYALESLSRVQPPFVAIDEAHCISQWGHDFRPDYLRLDRVLEVLQPRHVLACTATATPLVRQEIVDKLGFDRQDTAVILRGFARPNLHLSALELDRPAARRDAMLQTLRDTIGRADCVTGAAIVYCGTRKLTESTADLLSKEGYTCAAYHAGLSPDRRATVNRRFAIGKLHVIAATNAFGMGIDRADIRAVVHITAPGSIESYYQEVGRAGRDGQPAHGVLISGSSDLGLRRRLIDHGSGGGIPSSARVDQQWSMFLDLMRYVEAGSCRHDFILGYFDDEKELLGGCGHCDVCERLEREGGPAGELNEADTLVVLKALSGVARAQGRAGMKAIAEMLHGKTTARIEKLGLEQLSTHGLLSDRPVEWLVALIRRLVTAGLVEVTPDQFPMPYLTEAGIATMKRELPLRVLLPPAQGPKAPKRARATRRSDRPVELSTPEAEALFERLREARTSMAQERSVPAYVICHDSTLRGIAEARPTSVSQLADVHGMGPSRIDNYGEQFLAVVRESA